MKTIFLVIVLFVTVLFGSSVYAQERVIERTFNGETYLIDTQMDIVKNKKDVLPDGRNKVSENRKQCQDVSLNQKACIELFYNIIAKVLPADRMAEFIESKAVVAFNIILLPSGEIESVRFMFLKKILFSLEEIHQIEKELLKSYLIIESSRCSDDSYHYFNMLCKFEKYASRLNVN